MHRRLFNDVNALFVKYIIDFAYVKTVGYPVYDNGVPLITGIKRTVQEIFISSFTSSRLRPIPKDIATSLSREGVLIPEIIC